MVLFLTCEMSGFFPLCLTGFLHFENIHALILLTFLKLFLFLPPLHPYIAYFPPLPVQTKTRIISSMPQTMRRVGCFIFVADWARYADVALMCAVTVPTKCQVDFAFFLPFPEGSDRARGCRRTEQRGAAIGALLGALQRCFPFGV